MSVPRRRACRPREADGDPADATADAAELLALRTASADHLAPWEPERDAVYFTLAAQAALLEADARDWDQDARLAFAVLDAGAQDRLVGGVALSNLVRGIWQNATLGYWIAAGATRQGHATRAVRLAIAYAFELGGLHRVQAAVIPRQHGVAAPSCAASACGTKGARPDYLRIAGAWQDHEIFAATVEDGPAVGLPSLT